MKTRIACRYDAAILGRYALAGLIFTAVFVTLTWPLALDPRSSILGGDDGWKTVEQFWWYKHAIFELGVSPLYDPNIFYPLGWYTATSSHSLMLMLPTLPFTLALGPITAYNLTMLWSFVLAAFGMYILVYRLTRDGWAGILGGVSFAFCMSRLLRAAGHLNISVGSAWIPWIFVCLEIARSSDSRRRIFWATLAGISYACAMFGYWYFVYLVAIPLVAYSLLELWQSRQDWVKIKANLSVLLITLGVAGLLVAPLIFVTFRARAAAGVLPFAFEATTEYGASPERFLIPNGFNPIWGKWFLNLFPPQGEQDFIFLGLAAICLAAVAILKRVHPQVSAYGVIALVGLVLAMGPELKWNGALVKLWLPNFEQAVSIPLPDLFFYLFAPLFSVIRVWSRFSLITSFAVAVLAGLAASYLRRQIHWGYW